MDPNSSTSGTQNSAADIDVADRLPAPPVTPGPYPWGAADGDDFRPEEFLINYNERHREDRPAMFRDSVIQQTLSCLIGKFKPNALLIGAAGVGKTKIAEDIARRLTIRDSSVPDQLRGCTVWELPLSNIVSGSGLVGEVERKTKAILKFAQKPENKAILFIDEIHMLVGEGQIYEKIAQIMKPALAGGGMRVIGATTLQEANRLMDDPAFNRRFTRVIVDELSQEQTRAILSDMQQVLFAHYKNRIAISPTVIAEVVAVADEYRTIGSHRPDNAITLLDRALADAYIRQKVREGLAKSDPAVAAQLPSGPAPSRLSKAQMKETAMKLITGSNEKTAVDIAALRERLAPIKGQEEVIGYLLDVIERGSLGLNVDGDTRPLTLLFAGNSGVGKTEVAKILAAEVTGVKPIILNMTEYHSSASINRIIGAPAGYIGSDSKGELPFDILESNPYHVILLDEFEKSDRSVQRLFMSAFDEGYIKTARGKAVDFSKCIIIATTNAGHTGPSGAMGFGAGEGAAGTADLSKHFDTELLNRFTKILHFNPITESRFREILMDSYRRYVEKVKAANSSYDFLPDSLADDVADRLVKESYVKEFGARPVSKTVRRYVEDAILAKSRGPETVPGQAPSLPADGEEGLVWEEVSREHIVQDEWIDFRKSEYRFPDGKVFGPFYSYSRRDYVVIVASDEEGRYLCVRQFRQGIQKVTTEFPAGGIERKDGRQYGAERGPLVSEDALETAKRELLEETGYASDAWSFLMAAPSNATIADNYAYLFRAERCRRVGEQSLDETEYLRVRRHSAEEVEEMIAAGGFQQAIHILAWLLARRRGR